ncbi:RseA family anti-sigma factor [[Pseudomonas] boreopolis]|uniref:sigma-E factor negative regulatory protein n=1 Tax=Xanthomonas boreopolis TaxID=86183 RepID=UPI003D9BEDC7
MSHNPSMTNDKFEIHYRQQLSALIDGELAADESRFLLRRLEHDEELSGCHERWQLLGDVLRGAACAPAPAEFAARVRAAVAAEPLPLADAGRKARPGWRWGGGAAIAASVAALALFMARERLPDEAAPAAEPVKVVATTAQMPASPAAPAAPDGTLADAVAAVPAVALASARRQDAAAQRRNGGATRNQQAARSVAARAQEPERRIAAATPQVAPVLATGTEPLPVAANPFAHPSTLQAKPWPRSVISGDGALNASFARPQAGTAFYPFEPRLPVQPAVNVPSEPPLPQP